MPESFAQLTVQAPFNDLAAVADALARWRGEIACILVEPVAGNMGCVPPEPGFLEGLASLATRTRRAADLRRGDDRLPRSRTAARSSAIGITPDLTILGKIVGGGLPAAAYGGRRELMSQIAPEGPVYQAGTLSGNPLAMAAGLETLRQLRAPGVYAALEARARTLADGLADAARDGGRRAQHGGGRRHVRLLLPSRAPSATSRTRARRTASASAPSSTPCSTAGVYLAPSAYEAGFVSLAHRPADVAATLAAARKAFKKAARAH